MQDVAVKRALAAAMQSSSTAAAVPNTGAALSQHLLTQMHLNHGLDDEQLMGQLRRVRWFRELSHQQLDTLFKRARHIFYPRYSVLLREGNGGSSFYVLMQGKVRCTSVQQRSNVVHGAGASFGDGALTAPVIRDATAVALEDSYLLQFQASDVADLPVEKPAVREELLPVAPTAAPYSAPYAVASGPATAGAPQQAVEANWWTSEIEEQDAPAAAPSSVASPAPAVAFAPAPAASPR